MTVFRKAAFQVRRDSRPAGLALTLAFAVIWAATAIDCYCCQWLTPDIELNPLARLILVSYGVWTLVGAKVFGTFIVTELLRELHFGYTLVLVSFQIGLVLYLMYA